MSFGRAGRSYELFAGRGKGYDVRDYVTDNDGLIRGTFVGHAVKSIDNWGRHRGWVILDRDTGEVICGAGTSTQIGNGLMDAIYMFEQQETAKAAQEPHPWTRFCEVAMVSLDTTLSFDELAARYERETGHTISVEMVKVKEAAWRRHCAQMRGVTVATNLRP